MNVVALRTFLAPLDACLASEGVREISVNRPGEVWIERAGTMTRIELPELNQRHLRFLGELIAESTAQELSEQKPLLSATLPEGYRVQIVCPPVTATTCLSIRKPSPMPFDLSDFEGWTPSVTPAAATTHALANAFRSRDRLAFLRLALQLRQNILISGGTSTGKTAFLNACLREIPDHERLITIEDAREIRLRQPNHVHLVASKGAQGRAQVTMQDLVEASLRLRPDRIIMGELRGIEAFSYLRAVNTGHPGSIATVHADTPAMAYEQVSLMVMQANRGLKQSDILAYVHRIVPVVVQLHRFENGQRFGISAIHFEEGHS